MLLLIVAALPIMMAVSEWPATLPATVLDPNWNSNCEPSGLEYNLVNSVPTVWCAWDNGWIFSFPLSNPSSVTTVISPNNVANCDIEGLTFADTVDDGTLYFLDEYESGYCRIYSVNNPTTNYWHLAHDGGWVSSSDGGEALGFLPGPYCTNLSYRQGAGSQYQSGGGLFLVGIQQTGYINVYDLDLDSPNTWTFVGTFQPIYPQTDLSALHFDRAAGKLYAVSDNGDGDGKFYELSLDLTSVIQEWAFPYGSHDEEGFAVIGAGENAKCLVARDTSNDLYLYDDWIPRRAIGVSIAPFALEYTVTRNARFVYTDCYTNEIIDTVKPVAYNKGESEFVVDDVPTYMDYLWVKGSHELGQRRALDMNCSYPTVSFQPLSGDVSNPPWVPQDGLVDIVDFAILSIYWGDPVDPNQSSLADVNGDGEHDKMDMEAMQMWFAEIDDAVDACTP